MSLDAYWTLGILVIMVVGLIRELYPPDVMVCGAVIVLMALGIVTPGEALQGFSNPAMITVGALFIVAKAMAKTGAVDGIARSMFGQSKELRPALLRLTVVTGFLSAFLNNTPIVAMFISMVNGFCKRTGLSPSKMLIPLSYAAILGGVCTLIGTSTNLLISGLLDARGFGALGMFEMAPIGLPVAFVGLIFLLVLGPSLLPERQDALEQVSSNLRSYYVQMRLLPDSPLVGQSVLQAGLRNLPGLYLNRIEREGQVLSPVGPGDRLMALDHLVFVGVVETVRDLQRFRGLVPLEGADEKRLSHRLVEVVVAQASPVVGHSVREANFRARYNAALVALHRHGQRLNGRLGDIVLKPGDTLLLEGPENFAQQFGDSGDFILANMVESSEPILYKRAWLPFAILLLIVGASALNWMPVVVAALLGAIACGVSGVLAPGEARNAVDVSVLMVIGASFGLAAAMEKTGAASMIAQQLVAMGSSLGTFGTLAAIFLATMILTETISNNAAAALMFPIAVSAAQTLNVDVHAFAVGVAIAASLSFATPLGYQTNLMVYGPGGYRFTDFLKVGLPMQFVVGSTALVAIYVVYL